MILDHTGHADLRPGHTASLLMKTLPRFAPQDLHHEVFKIIAGSGAEVEIEPSLTTFDAGPGAGGIWSRAAPPPIVGLTVNGVTVVASGYDRPAFTSREIAALDMVDWPSGHAAVGRCRACVEIAEVGARISPDSDQNHDRALAVTIVALAAARLVEVEGIAWHASHRAVTAAGLREIGAGIAEGIAPVSLWIGLERMVEEAGHGAGVVTRGLYPLLGAEIEVGQSGFPKSVAFDIALQLAERILTDGRMPEHASRMGFGPGRDFVVRHMPRGIGHDAPVLSLTPDSRAQVAGAA
jgi:hypothetical protein